MLTITITGTEYYDEEKQEFLTKGDVQIQLEHSLASLSKWEEVYEKPFLTNEPKTNEETIAYIKFMTVTPDIPSEIFSKLNEANFEAINDYINAKRSATWFSEIKSSRRESSEVITSELVYYWMIGHQVPMECQHWHLNRLFNLLKICNLKNEKPKKIPRNELAARNRALNAARKQQLGTTG